LGAGFAVDIIWTFYRPLAKYRTPDLGKKEQMEY